MKVQLITTLVAAPLLALSSMAYAADPVLLTNSQLDSITASEGDKGHDHGHHHHHHPGIDFASITQINQSDVTIVQVGGNNEAFVISGNFASIDQH